MAQSANFSTSLLKLLKQQDLPLTKKTAGETEKRDKRQSRLQILVEKSMDEKNRRTIHG